MEYVLLAIAIIYLSGFTVMYVKTVLIWHWAMKKRLKTIISDAEKLQKMNELDKKV